MIEGIIREHNIFKNIRAVLLEAVNRLSAMSGEELRNQRYEKFRKIGVFNENI